MRFPSSVCPDYRTFASAYRRLGETGTFAVNRTSTGQGQSVRTPQCDADVLQRFENNPSTSTRAVGQAVGVDRLVWKVVRQQQLHSFHRQKVQALGPNDYLR